VADPGFGELRFLAGYEQELARDLTGGRGRKGGEADNGPSE
jgi:hypothetical protein